MIAMPKYKKNKETVDSVEISDAETEAGEAIGDICNISIRHFPENILLEILRYLPVKDRCIAGSVCKQWRRVVKDNSLWRHVDLLEYRLDLLKMWKVLRAHFSPCLLTIRIKGFAHAASNKRKASLSDAMLKELSSRCPNLFLLQLHDCITDNLTFNTLPAGLTSLLITDSTWKPRWLKDQHLHLTKLESLDLSRSVRVDNFDLEDVAEWSALKHLSLSGCYRINGLNFEVIAKNLTQLETLNVSGTGVDQLAIHHIARYLKLLQELHVASCSAIDDGCLSLIASGLSQLHTIDVSYCDKITVSGIESLSVLQHLKLIICLNKFTDADIDHLKKNFSHVLVIKT